MDESVYKERLSIEYHNLEHSTSLLNALIAAKEIYKLSLWCANDGYSVYMNYDILNGVCFLMLEGSFYSDFKKLYNDSTCQKGKNGYYKGLSYRDNDVSLQDYLSARVELCTILIDSLLCE